MSLANFSEKMFRWFGEKVSPAFVSASIAGAKGVFRPTFTMLDKKQDKETRTYAAMREGLTEVIAIPVYLASGALASIIAEKKATPKGMHKDVFKNIIKNVDSFDIKTLSGTEFKEFNNKDLDVIRKNFFKMKGTMSMIGVFAAALIVIPLLCSLSIKPFMNSLQHRKRHKNTQLSNSENINFKQNPYNNIPTVNSRKNIKNVNYGYIQPLLTEMGVL